MSVLAGPVPYLQGSNAEIFGLCALFSFIVVTALWIVGLFQGSHSIVDGWYRFAYVVPAWFAFYLSDATSQVAAVLLLMTSMHGCRLGYYLAAQWRRYVRTHGGDPRYFGFVERYSPGYWWKSFFRVMEPQAVAIVVIGSPAVWGILVNATSVEQIGPLITLGMLVFAVGLYYETVADAQLQAFLAAQPHNKGRYLNTGVWTYSRHPNYFGTTIVWWGIWIVAVSGSPEAWWTMIGPVMNTVMLTSVLGSKLQDKYMGDRPDYQRLMMRTRSFLPFPRRIEPVSDLSRARASGADPPP